MNNRKYFLCIPLIAVLFLQTSAQNKKHKKAPIYHWSLISTLYLSDSTGAGLYNQEDKKYGIAFLDESGLVAKEVLLPGYALGMGKLNDKIIAFYTLENILDYKNIKSIHGVLLDTRSMTILQDRVVYEYPGENKIINDVQNDTLGNFQHLLVRETAIKGSGHDDDNEYKYKILRCATTSLTQVKVSDRLESSASTMTGAAIGGNFISTCTNRQGETFIISQSNDQLIAEQFGQDGKLLSKLTSPLELEAKSRCYFGQVTRLDTTTDKTLSIAIKCSNNKKDHTLTTICFDFANDLAWNSGTKVLNKSYRRELKKAPGYQKIEDFKYIENLIPMGVIALGDKWIVWNDIQRVKTISPPNASSYNGYINAGSIVSVYDKKMQLLQNVFLDKFYMSYLNSGSGFSFHVTEGKLIALGSEKTHPITFTEFYYTLDPEKLTISKQPADKERLKISRPLEPTTVYWFRHNVVVNRVDGQFKLIGKAHLYGSMEPLDFPDPAADKPTKK